MVWIEESVLLLHATVTEVQQNYTFSVFFFVGSLLLDQGQEFFMFANTILN